MHLDITYIFPFDSFRAIPSLVPQEKGSVSFLRDLLPPAPHCSLPAALAEVAHWGQTKGVGAAQWSSPHPQPEPPQAQS